MLPIQLTKYNSDVPSTSWSCKAAKARTCRAFGKVNEKEKEIVREREREIEIEMLHDVYSHDYCR